MADRQPPKDKHKPRKARLKAQRLKAHAIQAHAITKIIAESLKKSKQPLFFVRIFLIMRTSKRKEGNCYDKSKSDVFCR